MSIGGRTRRLLIGAVAAGTVVLFGVQGCGLFESARVSKGRSLYQHYCVHCHGESGRQNEGFNWITMPDPRPRDLSIRNEMESFGDEELFLTIYRDMKNTSEGGDPIGDDEFAVPTMPTFKYTLSQDEIWAVVAYVRSLHGLSLTYDVEGQVQKLQERVRVAEQQFEQAKKALELAEQKAEAAETDETVGEEELEEATLAEEEAVEEAEVELEEAKQALESFTKRPRQAQIPRPVLTASQKERKQLAQKGRRLYLDKYGCNACHSIDEQGGIVGPALDRAGFRLNDTWIYRWIRYPQAMKRKSRMPNLGITDQDARAITMYLRTLRAPKSDRSDPSSTT